MTTGTGQGEIIYLKASVPELDFHEEGHALGLTPDDDKILGPLYTVMYAVYNPAGTTTPSNADIEGMLEVQEETYQMDKVNNTNGLGFD